MHADNFQQFESLVRKSQTTEIAMVIHCLKLYNHINLKYKETLNDFYIFRPFAHVANYFIDIESIIYLFMSIKTLLLFTQLRC